MSAKHASYARFVTVEKLVADLRKYNIRQDAPRFLKVESNQSQLDIYSGYEYHTQNVGQVNMIRNDKTGDIWVLPLGKSVIEIYDSAFNHTKDIIIQSEVSGDAEISVYDSPSGKSVGYVRGYPVAFTDATISPDYNYVYICFVGKSIGKNDSEDNKPMYVLVMNWDGEMIDVLYSPFYIYSLSVIDSGLYATVRDNDENRILVKLRYE